MSLTIKFAIFFSFCLIANAYPGNPFRKENDSCRPNNQCQAVGQVCCWELDQSIGCCEKNFKCCPSLSGDRHNCCPVKESECNNNNGASCYLLKTVLKKTGKTSVKED
ncbi:DgyrCDS4125 [Dimorphilus gyrociliatus]|uniref:DgyrCDS4125 n=1 Tax=Dimorphilus gyrociliatus TaxID=2664684 RepID=A0A7I8VG05_9ANNE|nr:DgyrCDS4125 [Dimorphilus gyrociliatus]